MRCTARKARRLLLSGAMTLAGWTLSLSAAAAELWRSDDGAELRWDVTLQQTEAWRTSPASPALLGDINADDGDRHQPPGLISDRSDLFSEIDYANGGFGVNLGLAAWYDPVYLHSNHNNPAATFNPVSVSPGELPSSVREIEGLDADVLDAFVHDKLRIGGLPVTLRVGRHTLIWGESLFFGGNGIAALQAPQDLILARSLPDATAKQLFLPVTQLSATVQIRPGLSLELYDQPEWRRDRLPGVSTVFSTNDTFDLGGERLFLPNGQALLRGADRTPAAASDQFGIALHDSLGEGSLGAGDLGFYALMGDAHDPLVVADPRAGQYHLLFPGHIGVVGASASWFLDSATLAGEMSLHTGVPVGAPGLLTSGQAVPRADSLNAQVSVESQLPPTLAWASADLSAELAGNVVLSASSDAASQSQAGRATAALEVQFEPHYYHVLPGIDLSPSATLSYGLTGRSDIDDEMQAGAGALTVGLDLTWRVLWHLRLRYTQFVGAPSQQPLADRDFASISLMRSF